MDRDHYLMIGALCIQVFCAASAPELQRHQNMVFQKLDGNPSGKGFAAKDRILGNGKIRPYRNIITLAGAFQKLEFGNQFFLNENFADADAPGVGKSFGFLPGSLGDATAMNALFA